MLNVKSRLSEKKGLTLVEILVATSLLAMIILAVSNVLITGLVAANSAKQQTIAVNLAQGKMEEILAQNIVSPKETTGPEDFNEVPGYKYIYKIEQYPSSDNLWAVTVTVYYDKNGQQANEVTLYTLKRKGK